MQGSSGRDVKEVNHWFEIQENRKKAIRECEGISLRLLTLEERIKECDLSLATRQQPAVLGATVVALRQSIEEVYKRDAEAQGG